MKEDEYNTHDDERSDAASSDDDVSFEPEDGEGNEEALSGKLKKLRAELARVQAEKAEYLAGWQRAKADYVNLKKEADERFAAGVASGKSSILESLLPALDSFDMAMANKEAWEAVDARWRTGIEYIKTQLLAQLQESGVARIGVPGERFDPALHESIETVPVAGSGTEDTIHSVLQAGYKIGDRIIRPARVRVYGNG